MKELSQDRQLYISARIWHEMLPKVDISPFIYALHEGIHLADYGAGLAKYYFSFIIVTPDDAINLPYARFSRKKREADVAVAIPYAKMQQAGEAELVQLMESAYLSGIEQLRQFKIADFDLDAFRSDVERLFSQQGWYRKALRA